MNFFHSDVPFILASASPRRKDLLASLGLEFQTVAKGEAEPEPFDGESPRDFAIRSARAKGLACANRPECGQFSVILAADTVVSMRGKIFGKPENPEHALAMLACLNGQTHQVFTAFYLNYFGDGRRCSYAQCERTDVTFANWSQEILANYAHSPEPADKAGSYAIQGYGAFLVKKISGSWTNVVGLPLEELVAALLKFNLIRAASRQ